MNIFNQRSKEKLTFLKDIRKDIDVYLNGEFKYFKIHLLDLQGISNFINFIDLNKICLVIPFISSSCKLDDPYLILSKQILISNYSSDLLIHDYLYNQFEKAIINFGIAGSEDFYLILKYKYINLELKQNINILLFNLFTPYYKNFSRGVKYNWFIQKFPEISVWGSIPLNFKHKNFTPYYSKDFKV